MGKRNYRFFYAFILSLSFLTAFIFACVVTHLMLRELGVRGAAGETVVTAPLSYMLACAFLPRLSAKQLPLHFEGDTCQISFVGF